MFHAYNLSTLNNNGEGQHWLNSEFKVSLCLQCEILSQKNQKM